jgi:hypothetical protein
MTTVNLDTQDPREFLDQVQKIPYSLTERVYDVVAPVLSFAGQAIATPLFAPSHLASIMIFSLLDRCFGNLEMGTIKVQRLTKETILESSFSAEMQLKLISVLKKTEEFAQKAQIGPFELYYTAEKISDDYTLSESMSFYPRTITINDLSQPEDVMVSVIASELLTQNNYKVFQFVNLLAVANIVGNVVNLWSCLAKKQTGLQALVLGIAINALSALALRLNTNRLAREYIQTLLPYGDSKEFIVPSMMKLIKNKIALKQKLSSSYSPISYWKYISITPQGNSRGWSSHTGSLKDVLNFKASDETSQTQRASVSG